MFRNRFKTTIYSVFLTIFNICMKVKRVKQIVKIVKTKNNEVNILFSKRISLKIFFTLSRDIK